MSSPEPEEQEPLTLAEVMDNNTQPGNNSETVPLVNHSRQHSRPYIVCKAILRMLKMLILPLIVFSLIAGLGSLESKVAGSLGWKTILYYFSTTVMAICLGLILVVSIQPGGRLKLFECSNSTHGNGVQLELVDTILDLIR